MKDRYLDVLEECLAMLKWGVAPEVCLSFYPEQTIRLRPILAAAQMAQRLSHGIEIPEGAISRSWIKMEARAAVLVP